MCCTANVLKNEMKENWFKNINSYSFTFPFADSFAECDGLGSYTQVMDCCSSSNLCGIDEGDCDDSDECQGHLLCGYKNCPPYQFSSSKSASYWKSADCCYDPFPGKQRISTKFAKKLRLILKVQ